MQSVQAPRCTKSPIIAHGYAFLLLRKLSFDNFSSPDEDRALIFASCHCIVDSFDLFVQSVNQEERNAEVPSTPNIKKLVLGFGDFFSRGE